VFRALWIAQLGANLGTWTQTVGAQWLMGDLGGGALEIALVQAATTLPVFLLVVPAGALGDIFDRRRLLLLGQLVMFAGAAGLAACTATGLINEELLLALIAVMAVGQALSQPVFQAIQPELVPHEEIPQAALLNGANTNVARAAGPALGGVLIAAVGPEATFALNTLSFLGVLGVIFRWRRPRDERPLGAERISGAIMAGARYVRSAPAFAKVIARSMLFMVFASGLWALLPAIARGPLDLGAGGYGMLLGCIGVGAVCGAFVLPVLRAQLAANVIVTGAMAVYGGAMAVTGLVRSVPAVVVALMLAGFSWIAVLSTLNATAQVLLPAWTRARALAYYQLVFMGGQALGAIGWGVIADVAGLAVAFAIPAIGLGLAAVWGLRRLPLPVHKVNMAQSQHWPEPPEELPQDPDAGPVLVIAEWRVAPDDAEEFITAMRPVGRSRRRTGASLWGLFRDAEDPELFLETFTVATWREHLRQHLERGTKMDEEIEVRAAELTIDGQGPNVRHLTWAPSAWPGRAEG
jgi:MFS family permease